MPDETERSYTADDLVAEAAASGTPVSRRLIVDWVDKGLLDRPLRRGLGRGRGTVATWPESQRKLFRVLLEHRRDVKRQASLCNVPVTLWLDSEGLDAEYVPLRQVRRCLETWTTAYRATSRRGAQQTAKLVIEQHGIPNISRRAHRELIDAVVSATGGGRLDPDALRQAGLQAFDSERVASQWARTVEARCAAIERLSAFDDHAFESARTMVNQTAAIYGDQRLGNTTGNERAKLAMELINELADGACLGLLTGLGFLELARQQEPTIPYKSAPRLREKPGAMARGGPTPHAEEHANARQRAS